MLAGTAVQRALDCSVIVVLDTMSGSCQGLHLRSISQLNLWWTNAVVCVLQQVMSVMNKYLNMYIRKKKPEQVAAEAAAAAEKEVSHLGSVYY